MKKLLLASALIALSAVSAIADDTVTMSARANMQSYRDKAMRDLFTSNVADKQVETALKVECQAGISDVFKRQDQACAVSGNGAIINPTNQKRLPRTQFAGGYIVRADGYTDASSLSINYLPVGKVPASSEAFSGNLTLKPEAPSTGALAIRDSVLSYLKADTKNAGKLIDERIDSIQFSNFEVPSAGLPSDKGCVWNGNMIFSYQTSSWFIDVNARCNDRDMRLKGNMPWTESVGTANQTQYDLNLVLPSGSTNTDDALFAGTDGTEDIFATADGISGQIIMKESGYVNTLVDGEETKVATNIEISGNFTGHNVPVETVRSFATVMSILSKTFFGA